MARGDMGGVGNVGLMVGFDDLKGLFQPRWFSDSQRPLPASTQAPSPGGFRIKPPELAKIGAEFIDDML